MPSAGQTFTAPAANNVPFSGNDIPWEKVLDVRSDLDDRADELVSDDHWNRDGLLSPCIPVVDVQVGTAYPRFLDFDQAIIDPDFGKRDILELESHSSVVFDECFHGAVGPLGDCSGKEFGPETPFRGRFGLHGE